MEARRRLNEDLEIPFRVDPSDVDDFRAAAEIGHRRGRWTAAPVAVEVRGIHDHDELAGVDPPTNQQRPNYVVHDDHTIGEGAAHPFRGSRKGGPQALFGQAKPRSEDLRHRFMQIKDKDEVLEGVSDLPSPHNDKRNSVDPRTQDGFDPRLAGLLHRDHVELVLQPMERFHLPAHTGIEREVAVDHVTRPHGPAATHRITAAPRTASKAHRTATRCGSRMLLPCISTCERDSTGPWYDSLPLSLSVP